MSLLQDKLAQSGDHHHSHGIIGMMIEGAVIGGVAARWHTWCPAA